MPSGASPTSPRPSATLYTLAASGLRAFSGVTVGLLGSVTNTHVSLGLSALAFVVVEGA